jgi:glycerophosphoryl diester phosphodiesterase
MPSFARALNDGAAGFEFDVRVTADGVAVLMHDERIDRTTAGEGLLREISADDLPAETPHLTHVLDEYLGRCALAMELKESVPDAVLRDVAARVRTVADADFRIASFQEPPLAAARDLVPDSPRALILRQGQPLPSEPTMTELGLWGLFLRQEDVTAGTAVHVRDLGLGLYAYTVNDAARASELAALGVDGIISDDPGAIRGVLPVSGR